jgi:hypothetical protein
LKDHSLSWTTKAQNHEQGAWEEKEIEDNEAKSILLELLTPKDEVVLP